MDPESAMVSVEMLAAYKQLFQPESNPFTPWIPVVSAVIGGLIALSGNAVAALFKQRNERAAISGMITAEITSILIILSTRQLRSSLEIVHSLIITVNEDMSRNDPEYAQGLKSHEIKNSYSISPGYNKIYLANGDKLGLIRQAQAKKIVTFYALLESFLSDIGKEGGLNKYGSEIFYNVALKNLDRIEDLGVSIIENKKERRKP